MQEKFHSKYNTKPVCLVQRTVRMLRMTPPEVRREISVRLPGAKAAPPEVKSLGKLGQVAGGVRTPFLHSVFPHGSVRLVQPGWGASVSTDKD